MDREVWHTTNSPWGHKESDKTEQLNYWTELKDLSFPGDSDGKEFAYKAEDLVQSLGLEDPLEKEGQHTLGFLPGEFHG